MQENDIEKHTLEYKLKNKHATKEGNSHYTRQFEAKSKSFAETNTFEQYFYID